MELLTFEGLILFIMLKEEEIEIKAKNIDAAAGEMIGVLEDTSKGNVIFVRGWHGFGASAAVRAVAQRLKSSKSKFDRVIHVDCSLWKSMRALQKAIADELELPLSVMAIFDQWDEEDDFSGVDEGSRGVIKDIRTEIYRELANSRFVVIFHNGSDKSIDVYACGVPVISILSNKLLWTWHGRFRLGLGPYTKINKQDSMEMRTDVVINYCHDFKEALSEEAKEVATYMGNPGPNMNHMIVEKCFQYAYALGSLSGFSGWRKYASNLLVCDGIIRGQGDTSAWGVADALQRNMLLNWLLESTLVQPTLVEKLSWLLRGHLQCKGWVLVKHGKGLLPDDIGLLLSEATIFFAIPARYQKEYSNIHTTASCVCYISLVADSVLNRLPSFVAPS